jgi:hypothetical protein
MLKVMLEGIFDILRSPLLHLTLCRGKSIITLMNIVGLLTEWSKSNIPCCALLTRQVRATFT